MRIAGLAAFVLLSACGQGAVDEPADQSAAAAPAVRACPAVENADVQIPGGEFTMGANPEKPEEGPAKLVSVAAFSIDRTEVTNEQFAAFVAATGYKTLAERDPDPALYPGVPPEMLKPSSVVFVGAPQTSLNDPSDWWRVVDGASWKHPEGPGSTIVGRERHPVVHVGYEDALAYAQWRGRDLPTEAEWEFASRAGQEGARFEWGNEERDTVEPRANTWEGMFPVVDEGKDGYAATTAPVGCYPPSAFGLHDMTGNVWEWTRDPFPGARGERIIKGGSFLCADNYCLRYRPSARQAGPPDTGSSHIGFRTVARR